MNKLILVIAISFFPRVLWASDPKDDPPGSCELSLIGLKNISALSIETYQTGETPIVAGSRTGRLLILKKGSVAIVKDGWEIARVSEPGAVFGELSSLLDKPHTADVRALEPTQFYIAEAESLLARNPIALGYVASIMARRLDAGNETLVELKKQVQNRASPRAIEETVEKLQNQLNFLTRKPDEVTE
jgi:CRP-like cAMP-binding protein